MAVDLQFWMDHFGEHYVSYISFFACVIPILYLTKGYSFPLIQYALELFIYLSLMHVIVWTIVRVAYWFREESTIRALDTQVGDHSYWETPLFAFWSMDSYTPYWLFHMELVFMVIIIYLMIRYRPMKVQYKTKRQKMREQAEKQRRNRTRYASFSDDDY